MRQLLSDVPVAKATFNVSSNVYRIGLYLIPRLQMYIILWHVRPLRHGLLASSTTSDSKNQRDFQNVASGDGRQTRPKPRQHRAESCH